MKNQNQKSSDASPDAMERLTKSPEPIDPGVFERLDRAAKGTLPSVGYAKKFVADEARGREIMAAARRGERNFPPARQVVKP